MYFLLKLKQFMWPWFVKTQHIFTQILSLYKDIICYYLNISKNVRCVDIIPCVIFCSCLFLNDKWWDIQTLNNFYKNKLFHNIITFMNHTQYEYFN